MRLWINQVFKNKYQFYSWLNGIGGILHNLHKFGKIALNHFKFKKCLDNISQLRVYKVTGEYDNILTKQEQIENLLEQ